MSLRIICISDTHGRHRQINVPQGDIIVHAGDLTRNGRLDELEEFLSYFSQLSHKHKILIAGNHDWVFEREPEAATRVIPLGIHYLHDSGCVIEGIKFWGSPVQPEFLQWAFNRRRGEEIDRHWQQIPPGTDVLVTHGPCNGKLDLVGNEHAGCEMLRRRLEILRPALHICGHIHCARGTDALGPTTLVNAAICTEQYQPTNPPIVVELKDGKAVICPPAG